MKYHDPKNLIYLTSNGNIISESQLKNYDFYTIAYIQKNQITVNEYFLTYSIWIWGKI